MSGQQRSSETAHLLYKMPPVVMCDNEQAGRQQHGYAGAL